MDVCCYYDDDDDIADADYEHGLCSFPAVLQLNMNLIRMNHMYDMMEKIYSGLIGFKKPNVLYY